MHPQKARILLVDDVPEIVDACARLLGDVHDVVTATSPERALELCRAARPPFAVVVSDDEMPGMKGTQLLARIRSECPDTVRVMLTGMTELEVAVEAVHEGQVFRFLTKPFSHQELRSAVAEGVAQHEHLTRQALEAETLRGSHTDLERRVARQTTALELLRGFSEDLRSTSSLADIASLAAQAATRVLDGRGVHVQVWNPDAPDEVAGAGAGPEMSPRMHRHVLRTAEGCIGEIAVDLVAANGEDLGTQHRSLLHSIASSTTIAATTEFRRRERDRAQQATITALARLAEQRDNETGLHLERVSLYCRLLAEGLRDRGHYTHLLTDSWIHDLVISSPLHDIGKVGIPDSILLKPGKLTPDEWVIMKTHTDIGAATIESVLRENPEQGFLEMARDIAWCHHEKWDGSGYPRGLRGDEIPLAARILAIADVYDALTTVRPYKSAWKHEDSLRWIQSYSGTHFDPRLVEVLTERERAVDRIRVRHADNLDDLI